MFPSITFYQENKVWKLEKILKYAPISTQKKKKRKKKKKILKYVTALTLISLAKVYTTRL